MSLINDLRLDTGDDEDVIYGSGTVSPPAPIQNICGQTYLLLTDIRVDIGDDEGVDFGIVNPPLPNPEAPEIWGTIIVNANTYTQLQDDVWIFVNPTVAGPTTITLSDTPILGQVIIIKDIKGDASINNITVTAGVNLIDGFSSFIMTQNKQAIMLTWNGTEWSIV